LACDHNRIGVGAQYGASTANAITKLIAGNAMFLTKYQANANLKALECRIPSSNG
jgi:hypothetical protein